ncbi:serine/threonine-protein kinase [Nocardia sp. NPDC059177]|uniref:serine/threonine-protein kinase n=1 Tax=Nocardia sp. NPDC059177 TaxID=3346759 RepID=UPI00368D669E
MALQAGDEFAGYTIEGTLGAGGMGIVYLARHPRIKERRVALKVLADALAGDAGARIAFDREAAMAARLEHPNIVTIHDRSASGDPVPWLSMRHIRGGDVKSLLADSPTGLPPDLVMRLLSDAADALDYAHRDGVLHRDVKPANLLIEPAADGELRAVLGDFGIARALDATATTSAMAVTFAYAAPERFTGGRVDHQADIYSLGCTLHELLTGEPPFPFDTQAAVMGGHLSADPPSPHSIRPDLPATLDEVIAKVLAKRPEDRYVSCTEFVDAARRSLADPADPPGSGDVHSDVDAPAPAEPASCAADTTRAPTAVAAQRPPVDTPRFGPVAGDRWIPSGRAQPITTVRRSEVGLKWVAVVIAVMIFVAWVANFINGVYGGTRADHQASSQETTSTRTEVRSSSELPAADRSSTAATETTRPTTSTSTSTSSTPARTTSRPAVRPLPRAWVGECIAVSAHGNLTKVVSDCERGGAPYVVRAIRYPDDPDPECPSSESGTITDQGVRLCVDLFLLADYCYYAPSADDFIMATSCRSGDFVVVRVTRSPSACGAEATRSFNQNSITYCIRYL